MLSFIAFPFFFSSCSKSCVNNFEFVGNNKIRTYSLKKNIYVPDTMMTLTYTTSSSSGVFDFAITSSPTNSLQDKGYFYPCDDNLFFSATSASDAQSGENIYSPFTTNIGTAWSKKLSGGSTAALKVIEKNVSVTVLAGTFVCDKITSRVGNSLNLDTVYWNPKVGEVKYDGMILDYELSGKNF